MEVVAIEALCRYVVSQDNITLHMSPQYLALELSPTLDNWPLCYISDKQVQLLVFHDLMQELHGTIPQFRDPVANYRNVRYQSY